MRNSQRPRLDPFAGFRTRCAGEPSNVVLTDGPGATCPIGCERSVLSGGLLGHTDRFPDVPTPSVPSATNTTARLPTTPGMDPPGRLRASKIVVPTASNTIPIPNRSESDRLILRRRRYTTPRVRCLPVHVYTCPHPRRFPAACKTGSSSTAGSPRDGLDS